MTNSNSDIQLEYFFSINAKLLWILLLITDVCCVITLLFSLNDYVILQQLKTMNDPNHFLENKIKLHQIVIKNQA
ncbi:hypothetical protein NIES2100_70160 [Calothrix sp. NIES-2100]|nr:hypothetical protein NIES2100_70160 [Calothrix sp. NIES-2100]